MKNKILKLTLLGLAGIIIINNIVFFSSNILSWDVFGYYLYLPLKFIYHDLSLTNDTLIPSIIQKYHSTATFYQAVKLPEGQYVMKYSLGLSIFYSPFFFIGHIIAKIFHYPADGFSPPYQYSVFIGGIIYSIIGLIVLSKVLLNFFSQKITALLLIILVLATNYLIHVTMYGQNAMSSNYLFLTYSIILYFTILWHKFHRIRDAVILAFTCGITILSRPSEAVCLLIPLLWGNAPGETAIHKFTTLLKHWKQICVFVVILLLVGAPQFFYWKKYTGSWLFDSYSGNPGEGFEFLSPYLGQVLFSFRKGWLIYTPVMIFGIIGFLFLYKRNRMAFYPLLFYFIVNLYVVSSWSCWWYAQSFGARALIASYPVMAIPFGYFLTWLNERKRIFSTIGYAIILCFGLLNLFQIRQFHYGIIDPERMTKDYYFAVFGKLKYREEPRKLLLVQRTLTGTESFTDTIDYKSKVAMFLDFENDALKDSSMSYSGKFSFRMDSLYLFPPNYISTYSGLTQQDHAWIKVTAYLYPTGDPKVNPFSLVFHFNHSGIPYKYYSFNSETMTIRRQEWNKIDLAYLTPEVRKISDTLRVYFWYRGKAPMYLDDLKVEILEKKNPSQ